jgi:hypothetical protein
VVVSDEPEKILQAINDRAVTRLLVEDGEPASPRFERETLASAHSRIVGALAYSPDGRVPGGEVRIAGNEVTESYVDAVLDRSEQARMRSDVDKPYAASVCSRAGEVPDEVRSRIRAGRRALKEQGRPVETYRRLEPDDALSMLGGGTSRATRS